MSNYFYYIFKDNSYKIIINKINDKQISIYTENITPILFFESNISGKKNSSFDLPFSISKQPIILNLLFLNDFFYLITPFSLESSFVINNINQHFIKLLLEKIKLLYDIPIILPSYFDIINNINIFNAILKNISLNIKNNGYLKINLPTIEERNNLFNMILILINHLFQLLILRISLLDFRNEYILKNKIIFNDEDIHDNRNAFDNLNYTIYKILQNANIPYLNKEGNIIYSSSDTINKNDIHFHFNQNNKFNLIDILIKRIFDKEQTIFDESKNYKQFLFKSCKHSIDKNIKKNKKKENYYNKLYIKKLKELNKNKRNKNIKINKQKIKNNNFISEKNIQNKMEQLIIKFKKNKNNKNKEISKSILRQQIIDKEKAKLLKGIISPEQNKINKIKAKEFVSNLKEEENKHIIMLANSKLKRKKQLTDNPDFLYLDANNIFKVIKLRKGFQIKIIENNNNMIKSKNIMGYLPISCGLTPILSSLHYRNYILPFYYPKTSEYDYTDYKIKYSKYLIFILNIVFKVKNDIRIGGFVNSILPKSTVSSKYFHKYIKMKTKYLLLKKNKNSLN